MKKRALSLALALVMLLSLVPISAGAVNSHPDDQDYLKECTETVTSIKVKVKNDLTPYTLPVSNSNVGSKPVQDSNNKDMTIKSGTVYNVDRIYRNVDSKGNPNYYWYRVVINGYYAYIYAGDCTALDSNNNVTVNSTVKLNNSNAPGTLDLRESFSIKGTVKSSSEYITKVKVAIQKSGTDKQKKEVTFKESSKTTSYDISKLKSDLKFEDLSSGSYSYKVTCSAIYYYCTDGKTMKSVTKTTELKSTDFKVQINQTTVDKFMNNCVKVSTSIKVKATADGWLWSMPCINDSCSQSYGVKQYKSGDTFTADMIYDNHKNLKDEDTPHYWYRVKNGNSYAYLWAGNCEKTGCISDVKLSGESKPTQLVKGEDFAVKGTVKTTNSFIGAVSIYVRDSSGNTVTGGGVQFQSDKMSSSVKEYDLSKLDSKLDFQNLKAGTYTYAVQCATVYYYCTDSKTLDWSWGNPVMPALLEQEFTVHEHSYTSKVVPATCTNKGYTEYKCSCGDSYKENYIDALGHNTTMKNSKDATCTSDGYTGDKVCTSCGKTISKGETVAALGHNYSSGYCTRCGAKDPDYVAPHVHDYSSKVTEPTCTSSGYTTYTCSCGDSYKDNYVDALGHDYKDGACTRCGDKDPNYQPTHTHDTELKNAKDATCTEAGYTGDEVCKTCGETVKAGTAIAALGHDYKDGVCTACGEKDPDYVAPHEHSYTSKVVPATCTSKGYTEYKCSCGDSYKENYINALGHNTTIKNAKSATCTEAGYTGDEVCKTCGTTVKTGTAIAALGHDYKDGVCTACGEKDPNTSTDTGDSWTDENGNGYTIKDGVLTISGTLGFGSAWKDHFNTATVTSVIIEEGILSIGNSAFEDCTALTSVSIADSVRAIGRFAFNNCTALSDISLGSGVSSVGRSAFRNTVYYNDRTNWENGVLYIDYCLIDAEMDMSGDYNIKSGTRVIADCGLNGCRALTSVTVPDSVTHIGEAAFSGCDALTDVYYAGTQEQWNAISIGAENDCLKNATIHCNGAAETLPGDINGDGKVNILDLIRLKKYLAGAEVELVGSADVNGDGKVNILDLIRLKKFLAGADVVLN